MLTGRDREVGDGGESFAVKRHVGGEQERVGAGHRPDSPGGAAHPGHHRSIVHADHQLSIRIVTVPRLPTTWRMTTGGPARCGMQSTIVTAPVSVSKEVSSTSGSSR